MKKPKDSPPGPACSGPFGAGEKKKTKDGPRGLARLCPLGAGEWLLAYLCGAAAAFGTVMLLYGSLIPAILVGAVCGFLFIPFFRKNREKRQKKRLLSEFRDLLDSLSGSFSAGKNLTGALEDAAAELIGLHGKNAVMVREVCRIRDAVRSGFPPEKPLAEFAARCGIDDIRCFSDTVCACLSSGGNLKKTVGDCRAILLERITVEQEIAEATAAAKNELLILMAMPYIAVSVLRLMGNTDLLANTPVGIAVKTAALLLFGAAFLLGRKMTDIRV